MSLALEHVLAFLDDATSVLRTMVGNPTLAKRADSDESPMISVVVHARGDLAGFTWSFPAEVAARAAEHMVPGIQQDPELREAAASELANVLTGRGLQTLADRGVVCEIEPPQISHDDPQGPTYVVDTGAGSVSVTFHQLGDPPRFSGQSFLVGADAQVLRGWSGGTVEDQSPPTIASVLGIDPQSSAMTAIRRVLAAAVGAGVADWEPLEAHLPTVFARVDNTAIAVHWQPVAGCGRIIGVAMFVIALRR